MRLCLALLFIISIEVIGVIFRITSLLLILACLNLKLPETRHSNLPQTMDDAIKLEEFALPEIPDRSRIRRNTENNITLM